MATKKGGKKKVARKRDIQAGDLTADVVRCSANELSLANRLLVKPKCKLRQGSLLEALRTTSNE